MNTKSDFCTLIERLNANLIVIIENDFEPLMDLEDIFSKMIYLNPQDLTKLLYEIRLDTESFLTLLSNFKDTYFEVAAKDEVIKKLVGAGRIIAAFEAQKEENAEYDKLFTIGQEIIILLENAANEIVQFYDIFLKYGISRYHESYKQIFIELNKFTPRKSLRLYRSASPTEWDEINNEVLENTSSDEFCLFIVDKKLGDDNDEGMRFIDDNIMQEMKNSRVNIISIIYTSYPVERELNELNDYYTIEVNKKDTSSLKEITIGLGTCTYVHIFDRLKKLHSTAIDEAFHLALNRAGNMKYLASMADDEGITPFEAVNRWFDIARKDYVSKGLLKKTSKLTQYHYILGLTQVLSEEFLKSRTEKWDFETESQIQRLNTSEIYDYTINQLHLPPALGDIFEKNGEYFILMGQDCDLSVRKDKIARNAKMAELLKCSFEHELLSEKIILRKEKAGLNYFRNTNDEIGSLNIRFGNHVNADFHVLDLSTFKVDGSCYLNLKESLDKNIESLLPAAWKLNYLKLQEYFISLIQINNILALQSKNINSLSTYDISVLNFRESEGEIDYSLKRVCRLKDEFRDVIVKNYWDYRGRVGVNTIAVTDTETIMFPSLKCGYQGLELNVMEMEYYVLVQRSSNRNNNKSFSNLPVIINIQALKTKLIELNEIEEKEIMIESLSKMETKSKITFKKCIDENGLLTGIEIIYPYKVMPENRLLHTKEKVTLIEFFNKEQRTQLRTLSRKSKVLFLDNKEERSFFDENGRPRSLSFIEISRGICVPDFNFSVFLKEDTIYVESGLSLTEVAPTTE
ncbi:hypothetical protein A8L34_25885 [Bacillus sp. FJAT-27264]|uniref:hypothetical protein n=1 Tax=Paenibacillus sp. (strain DSM 101736 / FJAT-27264) TaxID=1850362 RepID=UPI00080809C3|nr:hypothetical protein [Bacillus sp. FJAT-27264]OBZ07566.1 hypothetical protein A8L34_25885 [Bacillus sp. FJAT-27264]